MIGGFRLKTRFLICLLLASFIATTAFAQKPVRVTKPAATAAAKPAKPATTVAAKPTAPAKPATTAAKPAAPPSPAAAWINGTAIPPQQLHALIANRFAAQIMRTLINDRLVRQEANRLGIKATTEEVVARFDAERKKSSSEAAFQRKLREQGLTGQAMLDMLSTEILLEKLLARENEVKEETVRKYYADHKSDYVTPAEIHLFAIVTETIEDAYLVRERLLAGDKFEDVAKELSKDPSKDKGGDMGWQRADALGDKALADVLLTMEPGVVSSPLRAGAKYYIALIKERHSEQTVSFEQAEKDIRKQLQSDKSISRDEYLRFLARKADIKVDWLPAKYLTEDYARLKNIAVIVDGEPLELSTPPVRLPNGSIIVPAKPVLQAVGARLDWKASDQTLTASTPLGRVKMTVGSTKAIVGTTTLEARDMGLAPVMRNGMLFIAPRAALTALGVDLEWNAIENALILETIEEGLPSPTVPPSRSGLDKQ